MHALALVRARIDSSLRALVHVHTPAACGKYVNKEQELKCNKKLWQSACFKHFGTDVTYRFSRGHSPRFEPLGQGGLGLSQLERKRASRVRSETQSMIQGDVLVAEVLGLAVFDNIVIKASEFVAETT